MFETFTILAGSALMLLIAPALYRVVVGPSAIDRIVAVNVIGTKTAVLLVVIGVVFRRVEMFVDFALAYGLLNFIGSLAAARYLHRVRPFYGKGPGGAAPAHPGTAGQDPP